MLALQALQYVSCTCRMAQHLETDSDVRLPKCPACRSCLKISAIVHAEGVDEHKHSTGSHVCVVVLQYCRLKHRL